MTNGSCRHRGVRAARSALALSVVTLGVILGGSGLSGIASAQPAQMAHGCSDHAQMLAGMVGRSLRDVQARVATLRGIDTVRVAPHDAMLPMDFNPRRLTILINGETVTRIYCG